MTPYYQDDAVTLYHGDCRDIVTTEFLHKGAYRVVSDPPYPNNGGHFLDDISVSLELLSRVDVEAVVFWSEVERPPVPLPLVALHVWHRVNVNGRPWEAAYHFCPGGIKRRSVVLPYGVFFPPRGYKRERLHPTRKPVPVMEGLLRQIAPGIIVDPFAGGGATLVAAKNLGFKAVGIEIEERYCEIAARRCSQDVLPLEVA